MNIPEKWLFCGDSITDGNHSLCGDPNHVMGHGFAFIAAAHLGAHYPQLKIRTYNTARNGINSAGLINDPSLSRSLIRASIVLNFSVFMHFIG